MFLRGFNKHKVDIIRNKGKYDEETFKDIEGNVLSENVYFKIGTDIKRGDVLLFHI